MSAQFNNKIALSDNCQIKLIRGKMIHFYTLQHIDDGLQINNVIAINSDIIVKVFLNGNELSSTDLKWVLPCDMKLNRYSQR
jgi:hypothetical protein